MRLQHHCHRWLLLPATTTITEGPSRLAQSVALLALIQPFLLAGHRMMCSYQTREDPRVSLESSQCQSLALAAHVGSPGLKLGHGNADRQIDIPHIASGIFRGVSNRGYLVHIAIGFVS